MKVILLQNIPKLGLKNEIKDVNEGYALNFLIPRKMAKFATVGAINQIKTETDNRIKKAETLHAKAHDLLDKLAGREIIIKAKANDKGHLFAQVHLKEIADAIGDLKINISEDWINLENPIRATGDFSVPIEAYGKKVQILLKVIADQ
ncbi:MAG TPA: 50S ribosomal protein L9 [Candidatus Paceibacterota bacterium]|nr:50S ribosomal protein L9 [Candidatus Paceibacterota bacterium]HRZ34567.1 50S ribosomal protein L9 [Candidatus Paceibacterota bacterium]